MPMPAELLPLNVRDAVRALRRADTLASLKAARDTLADAIQHRPEHLGYLLEDADRELQRRLDSIAQHRRRR